MPGDAGDWQVVRNGSSAMFSDGDIFVQLPVGGVGTILMFQSGGVVLRSEGGQIKVNDQTVGSAFTDLTNSTFGAISFPYINPDAVGRVFVASGADITVGGRVDLFGTTAAEEVTLVLGDIRFDPSFNRGGDTINIAVTADAFMANRSGSSLFLDSENLDILIPIGSATTLVFAGGDERTLAVVSGSVMVGDQIIGLAPANLSDFA